ncbi:Unhealthy ribosome biogenesis protein 2 homolog [Talaromyces islandicus]|uniref:Unhealthy ribosome biogenesis protein 2 homolog n=1 Tax=Talaromyces islandicus TaxID=28573 RepID=A0A0U1LVF2_TALIS|nr:Unhealthy ribosome biogenesis protein 2 homolog [Talaromyces islandicus]
MDVLSLDLGDHQIFATHGALKAYILPKVHQALQNPNLERLVVKGCYKRHGESLLLSDNEKRDKRFNWHRPTANLLDEGTVELLCFPGRDTVHHQALMAATYFGLFSPRPKAPIVTEQLPCAQDCPAIFENSNLRLMGPVNTVVIGYVDRILPENLQSYWETGTNDPDQIFGWKKFQQRDGDTVVFLGCMISLWGDVLAHLVPALKSFNKAKCILYIGKAGSLRPLDMPNRVIVTGNTSYLNGELISWENPLYSTINNRHSMDVSAHIVQGAHVTVSSPLDETKAWFSDWKDKAQWVDCEVGHIARACKLLDIDFGWDSKNWSESQNTIDGLLNTDILQGSGINIYFLPNVNALNKNRELCERLSQHLYIDPFFWSDSAYESNGFFMCEDRPVQDSKGDSKCSISRFLIKELEEKGAKNSYKWQYLSFFTLWISGTNEGTHMDTQILLCFDLTRDVMEPLVRKNFLEANGPSLMSGPWETYTVLAKAMTQHFDDSLWKFRDPIRNIEKTRSNINRVAPKSPPQQRFRELVKKYEDMYELSRHIIHARECLKVTADTFHIIEEFRERHLPPDWELRVGGRRRIQILRFYASFLTNIEKRAESFERRLQNETQLVYNLIAAEEASDSRDLLHRSNSSLNEMKEKAGTSIDRLADMKEAVAPLESIQKDSASLVKVLAEKKTDDLVSQALLEEHRKSRKDLLNLALLLSFEFWAGVLVLGFLISNVSAVNLVNGDGDENDVKLQIPGVLSWLRSTFS